MFIIGAWIVSSFWFFSSNDHNGSGIVHDPGVESGNDPDIGQEPVIEHEPEPSPEPEIDPEEEERLIAEQLEAERILAQQHEAELTERREHMLNDSMMLFRGYFYDEAIALLNSDEELINHETESLEAEIVAEMNNLVRFDGAIKHIFFHSLILHPEVLFPNLNTPTGGYNEGFIYQSELLRILPQLLERGYVLYNINDIFSKDENGNMQQKDIYLPPDKKPLVLSIDDPTYHYNKTSPRNMGFANRVILDEHGELATEVPTLDGTVEITYDGDVHIVIDAFVREHPEFSFRGHKGIIAATGYMGIFGYDLDYLNNAQYRQNVIDICNKFKDNGWLFANHSYTHNRTGFWGPESNPNNIRYDVRRWREVIEPIVGQTNIFIAPFGYLLRGEGMQVILDNGYDIYCTVDFNQPINVYRTHAVMGRIEIGGYSLVRYANTLNRDFFDVSYVRDAQRPPILSG